MSSSTAARLYVDRPTCAQVFHLLHRTMFTVFNNNALAVAATCAAAFNIFLPSFPSSLFPFLCLVLIFLPAGNALYFTLDEIEGVTKLASLGEIYPS